MSVRFILDVRVRPGAREDLMRAYAAIRQRVEHAPGLVSHQLCESVDDPEHWLVISEWESLEELASWDRSDEHGRLIGPMRACFERASSTKLQVRDGVRH